MNRKKRSQLTLNLLGEVVGEEKGGQLRVAVALPPVGVVGVSLGEGAGVSRCEQVILDYFLILVI